MRTLAFLSVVLTLCLAACGSSTSSSGGSGTPTPTPTCNTRATGVAEAWVTNLQQIDGTIRGGLAHRMSNFVYPLGLPGESTDPALRPFIETLAWAPDAKHLAVEMLVPVGYGGAGNPTGYPYIVDPTTHAVTRVVLPGAYPVGYLRSLTWADSDTLIILSGVAPGGPAPGSPGRAYVYNVSTGRVSELAGVRSTTDGLVRCSTLFYIEYTPLTPFGTDSLGLTVSKGIARMHRYSLVTHREIGSPLDISETYQVGGDNEFEVPGWDVSADGTHIVYQKMVAHLPTGPTDEHIASLFYAADPDGGHQVRILSPAAPTSNTMLRISPDGKLVAATQVFPAPAILTGGIAGGATRMYTPDGVDAPAWLPDSLTFDVGELAGDNILRYSLALSPGAGGLVPAVGPFAMHADDPVTVP
jgi:hypothetical protein